MKTKFLVMEAPRRLFWSFLAMAAAAAIVFSFGCNAGGQLTAGDLINGTDSGGGGSSGGGGNTPTPAGVGSVTISTSFLPGVINEGINPDSLKLAAFTFDQPMDKDATADYVTVYLQDKDGSYKEVAMTYTWKDALNIEMKWAAQYDSVYMIEFTQGWQTADYTAKLSNSMQYIMLTTHNPLDIEGDGKADLVRGYTEYYLENGDGGDNIGAGFVLPGNSLFAANPIDMPIWMDLAGEYGGMDPAFFSFPAPFFTDPEYKRTAIGYEAQNLGNVSGNWRSDFLIGDMRNAVEGTCSVEGEFCNDWTGMCQIDAWCDDVGSFCPEGYTCDLDWNSCESGPCEGALPERAELLYWDNVSDPIAPVQQAATFYSEKQRSYLMARSVGDVSGDGKSDFIVLEMAMGELGFEQTLYLFLGRNSFSGEIPLSSANASWTQYQETGADPEKTMMMIGVVSAIGDFNGDGIGDFATVAVDEMQMLPSGIVSIHYGSSNLDALVSADLRITSAVAGNFFGAALSAGDIDGDGKSDLLVGAPGLAGKPVGIPKFDINPIPGLDLAMAIIPPGDGDPVMISGKAYLFKGAVGLSGVMNTESAEAVFTGEPSLDVSDGFGSAVAVTDLTGDGFADMAIAAPQHKNYQGTGKIYIFHGRENFAGAIAPAAADATITHDWAPYTDDWGDMYYYSLGSFMEPAGDINNDGYKDLTIEGAINSEWGGTVSGYTCSFLGGEYISGMNLNCGNASAVIMDVTLPGSKQARAE